LKIETQPIKDFLQIKRSGAHCSQMGRVCERRKGEVNINEGARGSE
jgi:hypothetical protein